METPVDLWDIEQLSNHLAVSERYVRRMVYERKVPYLKVGKYVRFDPAEITDWLAQMRITAGSLPA